MADKGDIRSTAESAASGASEHVQRAASTAMDKAQELAQNAGERMKEATAALGERAQTLAGTLRERAPHEGMLGTAASTVADTLEHTGRYIQDEGLAGMADDVTELIRRNPIPAMLIGVGIGFLLAKVMRS